MNAGDVDIADVALGGAADKAVDLEGCKSPYRQLPGFGRLAYPQHGAGNQP